MISSFASPNGGPFGLAWDGTHLWNGDDQTTGIVYELTTAGSVVSSFAAPCQFTKGLTFDGTNLWTACDSTDLIYKLTKTGTILSTIPTPGGTARGLTWDGTNLWIADAGTNRVYEVTTGGTVLSSFAAPATDTRGLTWISGRLWLAANSTDLVYELTTAGTVLSSFSTPAGSPRGLTFDGASFWLSDNGTDTIYKLEYLATQSIIGTVFEDLNYGGGAGRDRASSSGVVRSGARVELYNNSGNFVDNTTTDASGNYSFTGLAAGNYTVRVVGSSVTSLRTGYVSSLRPVMTFRTNASSGTAVGVTDYVGGHDPATQDVGNAAAGWILNAATGVFSGSGSGKAHAFAPVTVSAANVTGVDFGWNFDTIVNTNNTGQGSLMVFIFNANTLGGDTSLVQSGLVASKENAVFMISNGSSAPGLRASLNYFSSGVATIAPASALPIISTPMVIDAQKQPGFAGTPIVRLDGAGAVVDGLSLASGGTGSTVRGLMLTRFTNDGLVIQANANGVIVAGNWIGTNGSGLTTMGNTNDGIEIFGANATIGGTGANDRNVIVNNGNEGINVAGAAASGNVIRGNYIGLEPDGSSGAGNGDVGIALLAGGGGNTIGGLTAAERNVISMNFEGIEISCANNVVQGNYIGTDATGTLDRGQRSSDAVQIITGGTGNIIGGTQAGAGNLIAFTKSGKSGVSVQAGTGNAVLGNSIHSNTALGIDLGNNGVVTANDGAKTAGQPNLYMDFPVFTSATLAGTTLTVAGYVGSAPGQATFANARVEVFKSDNDTSGYGEGRTYLGFLTANASGNFSGTVDVSGKGLNVSDKITGTATDGSNNTSEFGPNATVSATYTIEGFVYEDVDGDGDIFDDGVATGSVVAHLYRDGGDGVPDGADDIFVTTEGTDAGGQYMFGDLPNGTYWIVVDSKTFRPGGATTDVWAEQTYGAAGSVTRSGAVYSFRPAAGPLYGGKRSEVSDDASTLAGAEHVTRAIVSGADVTGFNFGFSFNVVANTRDGDDDPLNGRTIQGSLRQFLQNANGNVGTRSSKFAIPGTDSNYNAGTNSFLIRPATPLPFIDRAVRLDAATQAGYDGTPIIDLDGSLAGAGARGFESDGGGNYFRGFTIRNFDGAGIHLSGSGPDTIVGNYIGTDVNGTVAQGNRIGIDLESGADGTRVGGTAAGEGNVIAFNTEVGVRVTGGVTTPILGNSIFGNGGPGIDLGNNGVTPNNGTKNGILPNSDMDYPVFDNVVLTGTTLTVSGYVGSASGQSTFANARVEIFKADNTPANQNGEVIAGDGLSVPHGEGRTYLGFLTANASGNFSGSLTVSGIASGDSITGTATDGSGNTSEFGPNFSLAGIADLALVLTDNPDPAAVNGDLLYTLLITNSGPDTATGVVATNTLPAGVTLQSATPSQGSCSGTTTVTCNLGAILSSGTATIEILVVTSGAGTLTDNASVTANESDPVPGNNTASATTQVVAGSGFDVPLSQFRRIHSFVDYTVTGGSLRTGNNNNNPCSVSGSSTRALSGVPGSATVVGAYLYWAGSGSAVDSQVTLNGTALTADRTFQARYVLGSTNYDFFGGVKDVTAQVAATPSGNYTFTNLTVSTGNPYCSSQAVLAGWSLIVVYQDASVSGKMLVLYDGFDLARNDSTSYLLSGIYATTPPEAKATFLVWEGDSNLGGTGESLVFNGSTLSDGLNPVNNVYNSTINSLGVTTSYGMDLDTFDVSGTIAARDTLASTTVSVGADLVILNAVLLQVKSNIITGKVFEDVNYGGGAGRNFATAVAGAPGFTVPRPGAVVELYGPTGTLLRTTTTDANGEYGFAGLVDGDYTVRVPNDNVTSSRSGATPSLKAVQTYRTDASSGTAVAVTNEVGGADPAGQDAPANTTSQNLGSFFSQSTAPARIVTGVAVTNVDFGFNFDTVVNTNDTGRGSLRQFLTNANTLGGDASLAQSGLVAAKENAVFMISNGTAAAGLRAANNYFTGGVATISPSSALPTISTPMVIDAQKQPGWTSAPILELNGTGAGGSANGLNISGGTSTVRGLVINRFTLSGILLSTAGNNTIAGNYIGASASGASSAANGAHGVEINGSTGNLVGGSAASDRNVISWNAQNGIYIDGSGSGNNTIAGNYIGVTAAGTAAAPNNYGMVINGTSGNVIGGSAASRNVVSGNTYAGIRINDLGSNNTIRGNYIGTNAAGNAALPNNVGINLMGSSGNTIGGTGAGEGNVLSGNTNFGIQVAAAASNVIQGNTIGLDPGRTVAIPNTSHGISFAATPSNNTVGGAAAGAANVISGNLGTGIRIGTGTGNAIQTNSIYGNGGIGIDLGYDNVTVNNGTKNSGLPNYDMDFPVFTSTLLNGTTLTVAGYVGFGSGAAIFANARVEVFTSDIDPTGYGEGRTYLGFLTADGSGNFSGSITVSGLAAGDRITGTATDGSGNTSEFGANVLVAAPGYQPDAMIKLASEGAGAYATDNVYEATAATQVKSQGVVSASTATYNILFQNDGNVPDNVVLTQAAADNCVGYTVQYLDNTSTDRTAAVTGAGYTLTGMAPGAGTTWTLRVTPAGIVAGGSPACGVSVTSTSTGNGTKADQVRATTASTSASLTLLKSADRGTVAPGQDITYTVNASNGAGLTAASAVVVSDPIPAYTGFKVGSATFAPESSTLAGTPVFSIDNGAIWTYSPVSGGCAAPAGYDFCVTNVRWTTSGTMPAGTSFTVTFVVRVK